MFAHKPILPVTIDRWFNDVNSAPRLRELVENPYFELAVATLLSAARPTFANLSDPERNSQRQAWLAGYHDFANDLIIERLNDVLTNKTKSKSFSKRFHY